MLIAEVEALPQSLRSVPQTALHSGRDDKLKKNTRLGCHAPKVARLLVEWDGLGIEFREIADLALEKVLHSN